MKLSQSLLCQVWRHQLINGEELASTDGEPLRIIYPGRKNDDSGPDFLGAIVVVGDEVRRGNVEIHINPSAWRAHGHHRKPAYNGVILHVAMNCNTCVPTLSQDGRAIPVLALSRYLDGTWEEIQHRLDAPKSPDPCYHALSRLGVGTLSGILDEAGEERLRMKASALKLYSLSWGGR